MRPHYDFAKMKSRRNPYPKLLKQSVTIRLDRETVQYFRLLASKTGLPYQSLINLYLRDCAAHGRKLSFRWARERHKALVRHAPARSSK
jgi:uncharacterized protein (DUF4415 family)